MDKNARKAGQASSATKVKVIKGRSSTAKAPMLSGDRVIVFEQKDIGRLASGSFGDGDGPRLNLSLYEACLLAEEGKLEVEEAGKKTTPKRLMEKAETLNENFALKYSVFRDLRLNRGYIVKSGVKFGCDFVVYARGKRPGNSHSKWMVHVMPETARMDYSEFTRAARLATNVKKKMLFATVTERGPVYYEVSRAKL